MSDLGDLIADLYETGETPCRFCQMPHDEGTACPPLEFPGTEWDQ